VIVSAPATAAIHLPVLLPATSDPKDSNASKTSPFKNVFDSLALLEDPTHEAGAQEKGAAVPKSSAKKEPPADRSSGTEEASVLPAPIVPQKQTPILPQAAFSVVPDSKESTDEAPVQDLQPSSEQGDVASALAAQTQTTAQAILPGNFVERPALSYSSLRYSLLSSSPLSSQARLNVPSATSAKAAPAPGKAQATVVSEPMDAQSSAAPVESAPKVAELITASAVQKEVPKEEAAKVQAALPALPEKTLSAAKSPIRESSVSAQPSTSWTTEKPAPAHVIVPDTPVAKPPPASSETPSATLPAPVQATPELTTLPDQPAAPAPAPQATIAPPVNVTPQKPARAQAAVRSTSAADAAVMPSATASSTVSPTQSQPEPALAATPASASAPAPLAEAHEVMDRAPETSSSSSAVQHEAASAVPAPKTPLLPQAENFAFALRMLGTQGSPNTSAPSQSSPSQASEAQSTVLNQAESPVAKTAVPSAQPTLDQTQTTSDSSRDVQSPATAAQKTDAGVQTPANLPGAEPAPRVSSHWNDATVLQTPETGSVAGAPEPTEVAHANLPLAAQETHLMAPEMPKASASSEILLHLTGTDQSSAAIRIADRGGAVNVSVHASDPVLRESLRSNLGDLSNQLSGQGWKAEVTKSAAVATQSGSQQESPESGQRGSQQQQSFSGDRQPQRDRRSNGGQWQQELDQQILGSDALPGGN
jgi:hypothetical protein